jgi:hypothetical protein
MVSPRAIAFETSSLGVEMGADEIDIAILSMDRPRRPKLLSDRFAIGSDAAAARGNGEAAHGDPNGRILWFVARRLPAGRVSPKNARPFQPVLVIATCVRAVRAY